MPALDVTDLLSPVRPTGIWAAALVQALARDEAAGRRGARLTEPGLATWQRFRGRLTAADFIALLFEDAAVLHSVPFNASSLDKGLDATKLPVQRAEAWLATLQTLDLKSSSAEYLVDQARLLGLPTRMAKSELHVVKSHQRVLEMPGTGGQLSHYLATTHPGLTLHDNFVIACHTWEEMTMAGLVALDLGAPHTNFIARVDPDELRDPEHPVRKRNFDFVVGLHPDRGGLFRVENQLAIWYPNAKVLLV